MAGREKFRFYVSKVRWFTGSQCVETQWARRLKLDIVILLLITYLNTVSQAQFPPFPTSVRSRVGKMLIR